MSKTRDADKSQTLSGEDAGSIAWITDAIQFTHRYLHDEQLNLLTERARLLAPALVAQGIEAAQFFGRDFCARAFLDAYEYIAACADERSEKSDAERILQMALSLNWVFGKNWRMWTERMARRGVVPYDAIAILPFPNPRGRAGLEQFLLEQTRRTFSRRSYYDILPDLQDASRLWSQISPSERTKSAYELAYDYCAPGLRRQLIAGETQITFQVRGSVLDSAWLESAPAAGAEHQQFENGRIQAYAGRFEIGRVFFMMESEYPAVSVIGLTVHRTFRRLGVAENLMKEVELVVPPHVTQVHLEVLRVNAEAQALYKKLGFGPIDDCHNKFDPATRVHQLMKMIDRS